MYAGAAEPVFNHRLPLTQLLRANGSLMENDVSSLVNTNTTFWSVSTKIDAAEMVAQRGGCPRIELWKIHSRLRGFFFSSAFITRERMWRGIYYPGLDASHTRPVTMHSGPGSLHLPGFDLFLQP